MHPHFRPLCFPSKNKTKYHGYECLQHALMTNSKTFGAKTFIVVIRQWRGGKKLIIEKNISLGPSAKMKQWWCFGFTVRELLTISVLFFFPPFALFLGNCAHYQKGGWWYNSCAHSNLNGVWYRGGHYRSRYQDGVYWAEFRGGAYSLKKVVMMIRPNPNTFH